jgi:hypothetical protein
MIKLPSFHVGCDLGQVTDPSAVCVVKRTPDPDPASDRARFDVVGLRRFALGTPYPRVVSAVAEMVASPKLRPLVEEPPEGEWGDRWTSHRVGNPSLIIDGTGVGRFVMSLFLDAKMPATIVPLVLTGGLGHRLDMYDDSTPGYWVAKCEIVGAVQAGLQGESLKIVPGLAEADTLAREMQGFRVVVSRNANELYSARESEHDDLLISLGMALWHATLPSNLGVWGPDPTRQPRTPTLEELIHGPAQRGGFSPYQSRRGARRS